MKSRFLHISVIVLLLLSMLLMLTHAELVIQGAHTGLELWYTSVLPSIFPFMILTSLLRSYLKSDRLCYLGLLCGLPVGAGLVDMKYQDGDLPIRKANALLVICNLTSPMFLCGYIWNQTLDKQVSIVYLILIIYLPILTYALIERLKEHITRKPSKAAHHQGGSLGSSTASLEATLLTCIRVILLTGVYIMLFCIAIHLINHYISITQLKYMPAVHILLSGLEITNGIRILSSLPLSLQQKTALIAGLTSFGGICSIFQTKSAITHSELSLRHYICMKLLFGCLTVTLGLLIPLF